MIKFFLLDRKSTTGGTTGGSTASGGNDEWEVDEEDLGQ